MDFLKKTANIKVTPESIRLIPRGISAETKRNIIAKLCKYMPASRKRFWKEVEEAEDVQDLLICYYVVLYVSTVIFRVLTRRTARRFVVQLWQMS